MDSNRAFFGIALTVLTLLSVPRITAQEPPPPPGVAVADRGDGHTPPRLSFIHEEVSFWRPGAEDWTRAQVNLPLVPGDALYTSPEASMELEVGRRAFIRAGERTQVGLENQEPDFLQLKVTSGHLAVDVREIEPGHTIEINTPNAVLAVEEGGYYRVDVTDTASAFVARRSGRALVTPVNGEVRTLAQNEQIVIEGLDAPTFASYPADDLDAWDRWNYERSDRFAEVKSARYVPAGVYGAHDLDEHGSWEETREYGAVWTPRYVAADWAPYSDGRWVWDAYYGWTWVDNAPWGWAPAHYGRWVHVQDRWGWAPGPIVAAPVYAPAVVAFFGGHNVSVSIGVSAPAVGWVALGWGEPLVPWWGGHGYVGVPSWHGWGGPRVVNRTVINNTTIVNVNHIHEYQNARVRNAVVAERRDRFGRGWDRHQRARIRANERLQPVRGNLGVRPVSASLSPRRDKGVRPPDEVLRRPVVATRPGRDPARSLRAQGIDVRSKATSAPAPRIVQSARPGRDRSQQTAPREQAAPQTAPRQQQGVQQREQSAPRAGRTRDLPRKQDEPNRRPEGRSARPAPAPPASAERPSAQRRETGEAAGDSPAAPRKQARPQSEPQRQQAAPRVEQQAPQGRPQGAPRVEKQAPQNRPQQARPQQPRPRAEQRSTRSAPQKREAPVVRSPRQQKREQPPAVRARPESAPRQPTLRNARPEREPANRPERAQRKQQAPADAMSGQRPMSAGDAPQAAPAERNEPAKKNAPAKRKAHGSASRGDRID